MDNFAAPTGPPPPKVPSGWTARWNDQYSEWFYVNIYTKKSQWEKPTEPVYPSSGSDPDAPAGAPPGYAGGQHVPADKSTAYGSTTTYGSNNPFGSGTNVGGAGLGGASGGAGMPGSPVPAQPDVSEDERLARQLQEEEDARSAASRGQSDAYYGAGGAGTGAAPGQTQSYDSNELPPREQKRGLLGKLSSKFGGGGSSSHKPLGTSSGGGGYYGGASGGGGYRPQQNYGGGYQQSAYNQQYQQQQGYGGYPNQGYGQGGPGYGGGYGQGGPMYGQQQPHRSGLGTGGAVALGAGGGLLGGVLLGEAIDGGDNGGGDDGGGDYGGGGGDDGGGGDGGGGDGGGM